MKKLLITSLVCLHVLATPSLHAWQLPQQLNAKQLGIIAAVTAAVLGLMSIAWYKHTKKTQAVGQAAQPVDDGIVRFSKEQLQEGARILNELKNKLEAQATGHEKEVAALKEKLTQLEQALQTQQEMAKKTHEDSNGLAAVPQQEDVRVQVAELRGRLEEQLGKTSVETIFVGLTDEQDKLKAQVKILKSIFIELTQGLENLKGEVAFVGSQASGALETLSKNEQTSSKQQEEIDRHTQLIAQWALRVSELSRKIAASPTREDLEQFRKEQEIARRMQQRFVNAAAEKMNPQGRRGRVPVKLRLESVEPETTKAALALNEEAVDPALADTAEKLQLQQAKQEEELKQFMEEAAKLREKNKRAQEQSAATPAPVVVATLPDAAQHHTPSEFISPALAPEVLSPFGAATSNPYAALTLKAVPALSPVIEETEAADFGRSLVPEKAAELQVLVTSEQLQQYDSTLDEPASAALPMSDGRNGTHKRSLSSSH